MPVYSHNFDKTIIRLLNEGGTGVIRTDTLYGLVARADNERAVARIYELKCRTPSKSPIILVSSVSQLFDEYDQATYDRLKQLWPGKNSVILPSTSAPSWIVRDNASVAYRVPDDAALRNLLAQTGPLVAPSANLEGEPPAKTIQEAKACFGDLVNFYVDGGAVENNTPSRLYRLAGDKMERLR